MGHFLHHLKNVFQLTWNFKSSADSINAVLTGLTSVLMCLIRKIPSPCAFCSSLKGCVGLGPFPRGVFFPLRLEDNFVPQLPPEIMNLISLLQSH